MKLHIIILTLLLVVCYDYVFEKCYKKYKLRKQIKLMKSMQKDLHEISDMILNGIEEVQKILNKSEEKK